MATSVETHSSLSAVISTLTAEYMNTSGMDVFTVAERIQKMQSELIDNYISSSDTLTVGVDHAADKLVMTLNMLDLDDEDPLERAHKQNLTLAVDTLRSL